MLYGLPKTGHRSDLNGPLSDSEKGWGLERTAGLLNESIGLVSQEIKLAQNLEGHPELLKRPNKSSAFRQLEMMEHPERSAKKPWNCDLCEMEFVDEREKFKLELCPLCYSQIKKPAPQVPKEDVEVVEKKKLMTMGEWLGMDDNNPKNLKNLMLHVDQR